MPAKFVQMAQTASKSTENALRWTVLSWQKSFYAIYITRTKLTASCFSPDTFALI